MAVDFILLLAMSARTPVRKEHQKTDLIRKMSSVLTKISCQ